MNIYSNKLKAAFLLLVFTLALGCGANQKEHIARLRAYDQNDKLVFESAGIKGINIDTEMLTATILLPKNDLEAFRTQTPNGEMLKLYIDKVHLIDSRFVSTFEGDFLQLSMVDPALMAEVLKKADVPFTQNSTELIVGKLKIYDDKNNLLFTSKRIRRVIVDEKSMIAAIALPDSDGEEIAKAVSGRDLLKLYIDRTPIADVDYIDTKTRNTVKFKFNDLHAIKFASMQSALAFPDTTRLTMEPKNSNSQNPPASTTP